VIVKGRTLLVVSVAAALVLGGGMVAALELTAGGGSRTPAGKAAGAVGVAAMLRGLPQEGTALGSRTAPVTLVEFADPQCPYCAVWAQSALPDIVRRYVRPGKVRLYFNGMTFVGADSTTALRTALAAGQQRRFWNVIELLYENQGKENAGWVTDSLLRSIGDAVPGLDTARMLSDRGSAAVDQALSQAEMVAQRAGVTGTPMFAVGKTGGPLRVVHVTSLESSALTPSLDAALGR
jgi:protein-disulfide isomerase